MTPINKTILKIFIGAAVTITPPTLAYLQSRAELQDKYKKTNEEADAGYQTLVDSVKKLQEAVAQQHDELIRLDAQLEAFQLVEMSRAPHSHVGRDASMALPPRAVSMERPRFKPIPSDLAAAKAAK